MMLFMGSSKKISFKSQYSSLLPLAQFNNNMLFRVDPSYISSTVCRLIFKKRNCNLEILIQYLKKLIVTVKIIIVRANKK
jgi:hypothetical protein